MEISVYHYKAYQTVKADAIQVFQDWSFHTAFSGESNKCDAFIAFNKKFKLVKYDIVPSYMIPEIVTMYEDMLTPEGGMVVHTIDDTN